MMQETSEETQRKPIMKLEGEPHDAGNLMETQETRMKREGEPQ